MSNTRTRDEIGGSKKDVTESDFLESLPAINNSSSPPTTPVSQHVGANKLIHLLFLLLSILVYILIFYYPYTTNDRKPCGISNIRLTKKSSIDVRQRDDQQGNHISGMFVTADGTLLLTDCNVKKVKSFANDGTFLSSMLLSDYPRAIASINSTTAAMTTGYELYFLNISFPLDLATQKTSSFKYKLWRVTLYDDKIIAIAYSNKYSVKMLDLDGNEIWSTSSDSSGQPLFDRPEYLIIKITNTTKMAIVADIGKHNIIFLDLDDGKLLNTIFVKGKGPAGLTIDYDGNVYICYYRSSELSVWSPDFSRSRIILSSSNLEGKPFNIAFSNVTGELFVSYFSSNLVDRFQLACE